MAGRHEQSGAQPSDDDDDNNEDDVDDDAPVGNAHGSASARKTQLWASKESADDSGDQ
eukprot:gene37593-46374_t